MNKCKASKKLWSNLLRINRKSNNYNRSNKKRNKNNKNKNNNSNNNKSHYPIRNFRLPKKALIKIIILNIIV